MKKTFLIILLLLLLSSQVDALVYVEENFDDGAFNPPYKYICDTPEPPGCTNTATHVTDVKRAGTHSLECVFNEGGAAGIKLNPDDYGVGGFGNSPYLRMYIKFDPGFRFYTMTKLWRWHGTSPNIYININACGSNGMRWNPGGWWEGEETSSQYGDIAVYTDSMGFGYYVSNQMQDSSWVVQAGDDWWMIEIHPNSVTNKFDMWVQRPGDASPTKVLDNVDLTGGISGDFGYFYVNWMNDVVGGAGGKMWIDEIMVADEYIEPIGTVPSTCNDGTCDTGECQSCPQDCFISECIDGNCLAGYKDGDENCGNSPSDCACTGSDLCCSNQCITPACFQNSDCGTDPCKTYTCNNPGTCTASCSSVDITSCINNDNCCPSSCTSTNDNDCIEGEVTEIWGDTTDSDYPGTIEDTFINCNDINYVSEIELNTYTWPVNQIANAILIKWDLSSLPQDATITDATLHLYMSEYGGDSLYTNSVHKIINYNPVITQTTGNTYDGVNGWTPNACCDGFPMAQADISAAESSQETDTTIEYKTWIVTQMVQDWINNPSLNYGMLINSDAVATSDSYRYFVSSENSNANQRPKLVISYSVSESSCSPADTNSDNIVSMVELMSYIADWKAGSVQMTQLMTAIGEWKNGCS